MVDKNFIFDSRNSGRDYYPDEKAFEASNKIRAVACFWSIAIPMSAVASKSAYKMLSTKNPIGMDPVA